MGGGAEPQNGVSAGLAFGNGELACDERRMGVGVGGTYPDPYDGGQDDLVRRVLIEDRKVDGRGLTVAWCCRTLHIKEKRMPRIGE